MLNCIKGFGIFQMTSSLEYAWPYFSVSFFFVLRMLCLFLSIHVGFLFSICWVKSFVGRS